MGYLTNSGSGFLSNAVTTVSNVKSYLINKTGYLVDAIRIGIGDFGQRVLDDGGTVEASAEAAASYREITKDIYDQASLVLFPSGYKDNLLYSHKPTSGSGDFAYSRGTDTATRVGADGYIKKERANLLLQSNQFDTTWVIVTSVSEGEEGYDGTTDAWSLTRAANGSLMGRQTISLSGVSTYSIYAKINTNNGIGLALGGLSTAARFDLRDATKTQAVTETGIISSSQKYVGNGFYRLSITANVSGSTEARIYLTTADASASDTNGGTHIIQDVQIEEGLVATPYIETTTAPVYEGLTDNLPRIDYTGGTPSVLIEPSRTNIVPISEGIPEDTNAVTLTENYGTSPEGLQNSLKVQKDGVSSNDRIHPIDNYNATFVSGTSYSVSAFVKNIDVDGITTIGCTLGSGGTLFRLGYEWSGSSLTKVTDYAAGTRTNEILEDYGNGWWRIGFSFEADNTQGGIELDIDRANDSATTSIETYGWQLEQGSYPTSYIPTYGSSVTRASEIFNISGMQSNGIFGSNAGTIFLKLNRVVSLDSTEVQWNFKRSDNSNMIRLYYEQAGDCQVFRLYNGNDSEFIIDETTLSYSPKIAISYDGTSRLEVFGNGSKITKIGGNFTSDVAIDKLTQQTTDNNLTEFGSILFFPTALSDDDCEALTRP